MPLLHTAIIVCLLFPKEHGPDLFPPIDPPLRSGPPFKTVSEKNKTPTRHWGGRFRCTQKASFENRETPHSKPGRECMLGRRKKQKMRDENGRIGVLPN